MSKKELRVPDMSGGEKYKISKSELDAIESIIFNTDKACDWCGLSSDWSIHGTVYTHVTFDVLNDHHVSTKVRPHLLIECENCGNTKQFGLHHFGITTKGGVSDG